MQFLWDGLRSAVEMLVSGDPLVFSAAWRSIWISVVAVFLSACCGISIGLFLARKSFWGRGLTVLIFRAGMSVPTVLIGLLCYGLLSRRGPLGGFDLLYTPQAIILGEFFLALPIVVSWTQSAVSRLDARVFETARTLGANRVRRCLTYLSEARPQLILAILTAFARCFTELGIAMMAGGNLKYRTRTLTTATALETARGEFERGIAMSLVLLVLAMLVTVIVSQLSHDSRES